MTKDKIHKKIGYGLAEVINSQHFLSTYIIRIFQQKYKFKENCPEFSTQGQIVMWSYAMKFFRSCLFFFHKILKREYYYHYTFKGQFLGPPLTSQYVLIAGAWYFPMKVASPWGQVPKFSDDLVQERRKSPHYHWTTNKKEQMPPQCPITLTRRIQIRGQPIKNYNFIFIQQRFSVDAAM